MASRHERAAHGGDGGSGEAGATLVVAFHHRRPAARPSAAGVLRLARSPWPDFDFAVDADERGATCGIGFGRGHGAGR
jgi:hypothetical protein